SGVPGGVGNLIPRENSENVGPAWRKKVHDIVQRYGHGGDFWKENPEVPKFEPDYWEIWNEENYGTNGSAKKLKKDKDGNVISGKVDPVEYGDLLEESNKVIDEVDPSAKIVFGGLLSVSRKKGAVDKMGVGEFIRKA